MHELGLAQEIIEHVSARAQAGAGRSAWSWRSASSRRSCPTRSGSASTSRPRRHPWQAPRLVIIETPGRARCRDCGGDVQLDRPFGRCECSSTDLEWLSGEELIIKEFEVARCV